MLRYLAFVLVLGAAFIASCLPPPDGCTPASTRCANGAAEICDSDTRWNLLLDCDAIAAQSGGVWVCCDTGDGGTPLHACVPADACPGASHE